MRFAGIDIGSRTIAMVVWERGRLAFSRVVDSGPNPVERAAQLLGDVGKYRRVVATGYGRHAARAAFAHEIITEIKAHALGARAVYPQCRTVLDIGGQDIKVIRLDDNGRVVDFLMNEKCAAGTGKFVEVMAQTLGLDLTQFACMALATSERVTLNSTCAVFAETEVVSLLARGVKAEAVARAVLESVCAKAASMLHRVGLKPALVFTGGVALLSGIADLLGARLRTEVVIPSDPQIVGALGAALYGQIKEAGL
ncbi:acyl-CoA dehydratase activase [Calderihabitans maritimus]|uniref:CoA-substrate-specific enzyme activase n=1 Tax=Calderihabitans maritimus TaxID=1246530 RepID=A0A1Z5HXE5_9FIRM|nr:acyl-CoA dehydratase activase [Calderihabitans maritimus]GAW94202.1 CoA-substrate-specific enzyme activase [Calderihabitans maritimus]